MHQLNRSSLPLSRDDAALFLAWWPKTRVTLLVLLAAIAILLVTATPVNADTNQTTRYVASSGTNAGDCTQPSTPCRSIQYAISRSAKGDVVLVAAGTYTYDSSVEDRCQRFIGTTAVICLINEYVTVRGGFSADNWASANPSVNKTIIDGENTHRGVHAVNTIDSGGGITLEGFTIQNGLARGVASHPELVGQLNAFGGGVYIEVATGTLRNLVFQNNRAVGEDTTNAFGGSAAGGALAIHSPPSTVTLSDITFLNNQSIAGSGSSRGGYALGGAGFAVNGPVTGNNLHFEGNSATGGSTDGSGSFGGEFGDAQGGAFAAQRDSNVTLSNISATNNTAQGGASPNGDAGGSYGGALYAEDANLSVYDAVIWKNLSRGGTGPSPNARDTAAALAQGGGILTFNSNVVLDRVSVLDNLAKGGDGQSYQGSAGGGGIAVIGSDNGSTYRATLLNSVIAGNRVEFGSGPTPIGGGGGGLWVQGLQAGGSHLTIADNEISSLYMFGEAVVMLNYNSASPVFDLSDSIIANHTSLSGRNALEPIQTATLNLNRGLLANNQDENSNSGEAMSGTTTGLHTMSSAASAGFASPGSPDFDYQISSGSAAKDKATGSEVTVDRNSSARDETPDFGAYEAESFNATVSAVADGALLVSWSPVAGAGSYTVTVICPKDGESPDQGDCDTDITVRSPNNSILLTGLSNYESYAINVAVVVNSRSTDAIRVRAMPSDLINYIPMSLN